MKVKSLSRVRLLATPWTAAYQAPLSMGFSRQEYWSGVPLPSPKQLKGIKYKCLVFVRVCVCVCVRVCVQCWWSHSAQDSPLDGETLE